MKRIATLAAVMIMAAGSLSACGGNEYCDKMKDYDSDQELENLNTDTEEGQQKLIDVFEDLESSAPDDLKDDYELLIDAFTAFTEGNFEGFDQAKLQESLDNISTDAEENCDVKMDA